MSVLTAGVPLAARILAASLPHLDPAARAAINAGRVNARSVRVALAEVAHIEPLGVVLTRSEAADAARWLAEHARRTDLAEVAA